MGYPETDLDRRSCHPTRPARMPLAHVPRRRPLRTPAPRSLHARAALARIAPEHLHGTGAEAVRVRAEAFGIEPGRVYGREGLVPEGAGATEAGAMGGSPYIGEMNFYGFNFAPLGWALCEGQLLRIADYDALFALIGTTYGGDGQTTFGLPDLRGRFPLHQGTGTDGIGYTLGQTGGAEAVTLVASQLPAHLHGLPYAAGAGSQASPAGAIPAAAGPGARARYAPAGAGTMAALSPAGGGGSHSNVPPFLAVQVAIALEGIFPSQA